MKYFFCAAVTLLLQTAKGQILNSKIEKYASFLSLRNAKLIQCNSVSSDLKVVYIDLLAEISKYKAQGLFKANLAKALNRKYYRRVIKMLQGNSKKLFRKIFRKTGNVLLYSRYKPKN